MSISTNKTYHEKCSCVWNITGVQGEKCSKKKKRKLLKYTYPFFFFLYEAPVWSTETSTKHEAVSNRMWLHCRSTRPRQSLVWKSRGSIAVSGCLSEDECRHTVRPVAYVTLGGAEGCCPYRYSTVHHYTCCSWWNWWSPGEPCLLVTGDVKVPALCAEHPQVRQRRTWWSVEDWNMWRRSSNFIKQDQRWTF